MKSKKISNIAVVVSVVASNVLLSTTAAALESKPHKIGATEVTAALTTSLGYGDNVFRGSEVETDSGIFSLQPIVQAVRETTQQKITLGYEGNAVAFFDSSDDNYLSNKINLGSYISLETGT